MSELPKSYDQAGQRLVKLKAMDMGLFGQNFRQIYLICLEEV